MKGVNILKRKFVSRNSCKTAPQRRKMRKYFEKNRANRANNPEAPQIVCYPAPYSLGANKNVMCMNILAYRSQENRIINFYKTIDKTYVIRQNICFLSSRLNYNEGLSFFLENFSKL